jgi:hypothetical protein
MRTPRVTLTPEPVQLGAYTPKQPLLSAQSQTLWLNFDLLTLKIENPSLTTSAKKSPRLGKGTLTNQVSGPAEGDFSKRKLT